MTLFQWPSEWTGLEGELQSRSTGSLRGQPGPRTRASWPPEPCGPAGGNSGSAHGPCLTSQKVKAAQSRPTLCGPVGHTVSPRNSPGQSPGVRSLSLRQGIFLTQEWSWGLLHCRQLSHQGSPRTPECAAFPSSRASSDPGVEPGSPALQVESLPAELSGKRRASLGLRDAPARVAGGAGQGVENTGRGGGEQTSMRAPADPGPRGHPCVEVCAKRGSSCGSRLICKALADPQLLETDESFVGISHARGRDAEQDRPEGK